jgi:hypothetical protein
VRSAFFFVILAAASAGSAGRLIEGELMRVDLGKKQLVVRPSTGAPLEVDVKVDAATAISASGRSRRLEELKTGERVVVACAEPQGEACRALRVRAGPARQAAPPAPAR